MKKRRLSYASSRAFLDFSARSFRARPLARDGGRQSHAEKARAERWNHQSRIRTTARCQWTLPCRRQPPSTPVQTNAQRAPTVQMNPRLWVLQAALLLPVPQHLLQERVRHTLPSTRRLPRRVLRSKRHLPLLLQEQSSPTPRATRLPLSPATAMLEATNHLRRVRH
jgi:hypothetical protein